MKQPLATPEVTRSFDAPSVDQRVVLNRLKRANGQLAAVVRMVEEGYDCEAVVTQMAAVSKAITTAAFTMIADNLTECVRDPGADVADVTARLQKLFLSLA